MGSIDWGYTSTACYLQFTRHQIHIKNVLKHVLISMSVQLRRMAKFFGCHWNLKLIYYLCNFLGIWIESLGLQVRSKSGTSKAVET